MMEMENPSPLFTQLNRCWHWRWGRERAGKGCMSKSWELDIEIIFALVYLLVISRSSVMALDVDECSWLEKKIGEKI